MPWSFLSYIEQIMDACKKAGFAKEITVARLRTEMMRETGVTNSNKLGQYLHNMKELGYLKTKGENVVEFCLSYGLPYQFASDNEVEVAKPRSNPELDAKVENIKAAKILHEK